MPVDAQTFGKISLHIDEPMCVFFTEGLTTASVMMRSEAGRTDSDNGRRHRDERMKRLGGIVAGTYMVPRAQCEGLHPPAAGYRFAAGRPIRRRRVPAGCRHLSKSVLIEPSSLPPCCERPQ